MGIYHIFLFIYKPNIQTTEEKKIFPLKERECMFFILMRRPCALQRTWLREFKDLMQVRS